MICYFTVFKLVNFIFNRTKENMQFQQHLVKLPIMVTKSKSEYAVVNKTFVSKNTVSLNVTDKPKTESKKHSLKKLEKKVSKDEKRLSKDKDGLNKKKSWKKKIAFRRKNFGSLEEWDSNPEMKKILLWTGYGPQQEGMLLWKRVFNSIGINITLKIFHKTALIK